MRKLIATMFVSSLVMMPTHALASDDQIPSSKAPQSLLAAADSAALNQARSISSRDIERQLGPRDRSPLMLSLYGSLATLAALDVISTNQALARGATELNPLLKSTAGNTWPSLTIKGLATASTIYGINRISKHSRKKAIIAAVIANAVSAGVVWHNLRVVERAAGGR